LITFDDGESITVSKTITKQYESKPDEIKLQYYPIIDWSEAGLDHPSYVDILTNWRYSRDRFRDNQKVGKLTQRDIDGLTEFIDTYDDRLKKWKSENNSAS
jgi:hypothetical protein